MFTGIIQAKGRIARAELRSHDKRLFIQCHDFDLSTSQVGDSIAVNGVCLTIVRLNSEGFYADVSRETLSLTTLGELAPDTIVNLERALTLATPLGGHLVSGHIDAVGTVVKVFEDSRSLRLKIETPSELLPYIARKGSVTVDGVSLTVNDIRDNMFSLNIVPHTRMVTTIGNYQVHTRVNIEVDLIARYLERLLIGQTGCQKKYTQQNGINEDLLARQGYI